jgi:hypothetical protein
MAFDPSKTASGVLFKNDRKQRDTHPDYTGNIEITPEFLEQIKAHVGKKFQLSAWLKSGQRGTFLSLSMQPPWEGGRGGSQSRPAQGQTLPKDDIPF